jgi:hypothetical protein
MKAKLSLLIMLLTAVISLYPRAMFVTSLDKTNDKVICEDATEMVWSFYGIDDWEIGDMVTCIMDSKGTDSMLDDEMTEIHYGGYTLNSNGKLIGIFERRQGK